MMKKSVVIALYFAAEILAASATSNLRGNVQEHDRRELMRTTLRKKRMRRLRRKRRKMRQRARAQAFVQMADPWKMEGDDDGGDWEVFEETIDYWDDGDGEDTEEAAAAFEKELAEFEAAESGMSHVVSMTFTPTPDETEISSSATVTDTDVFKWFLVTVSVWHLI